MSAMGQSCERALALELRRAESLLLSARDERWLAEHRVTCPHCSAESDILALLEDDGGASPAEPLDDIARRRFIDDVLHKAEVADRRAASEREPVRFLWARPARIGLVAAAAAVLVVVSLQWLSNPGPHESSIAPLAPSAHSASSVAAVSRNGEPRLLLSAGDVRIEGRIAAVGGELRDGQRIETQSGSAVISIDEGMFIELSASARASIGHPMAGAVEIVLDAGSVLASVDPSRKGPKLSVVTPHGRATVTGTIFSVEVGEDDSFVRVARGKVEVDSVDSVAAMLPAGRGRAMISGVGRELPFDERSSMVRRDELFSLLDTQAQGVVDISSVPLGAEVSVDGSVVGVTPVVVALRAGHRDLSLSVEGSPAVRELMDIEAGTRLERVFDLSSEDTSAVAESRESKWRPSSAIASPAPRRDVPEAPTVEQLLFEAQALRASRQFKASAQIYQRIVENYATSDVATSSLLSLGTIELEKLDEPRAALGRFDAYLSRTGRRGPLAQEALYGRARALRALGRTDEEAAALEELLGNFSRSLYSPAAKVRLEQLKMESK